VSGAGTGPDSPIVVVSGLPRAGTSLVMQMLAAGGHAILVDDSRGPDADNPRGYFEYTPVRRVREDASWLPRARGRALKIVVPLVRDLPPGERYRVILVERDLREVMASQQAMLVRRGHAPEAPEREAHLGSLFVRALGEVERWLAAQDNVAWIAVAHAGILRDPRAEAERIAAFLPEARLDVAAMAAVVEPGLHRQRAAHA
jgi:hypothetical protein